MDSKINAVQNMQEYIDTHLYENITLANLSKVSQYSPWYSHRLFVELLSITPADYIRKLRLSKSAIELRDKNTKIIDVAMAMGFNSVDGYQRAFHREFGCNPKQYALNPIPIYLFTPYKVKYAKPREDDTMENSKTAFVYIQAIEKPARKAVIKRGIKADNYFDYCEEVGCDIYGLLTSMTNEPVSMWLSEIHIKKGTSKYVQGAEVSLDYDGVVLDGFDIIELPACKYLMFQGEPFEEKNYSQAITDVWDAIDRYNPSLLGYSWDNANPRIQLTPIGSRGYIELVPIK